jgi:hypothetical protein
MYTVQVSRPSLFEEGQSARMSNSLMDRGYDFEGVVRWLAERADVILLFFDPDKPGTTGETLSILTNSLPGMDHKLYIILNKVSGCDNCTIANVQHAMLLCLCMSTLPCTCQQPHGTAHVLVHVLNSHWCGLEIRVQL